MKKPNFSFKDLIMSFLIRSDSSAYMAVVVLIIIFASGSDAFASSYNIYNLSRTAALYFFIALGQVMVIIVGGMNLSIGAIGGLTAIVFGYLTEVMGASLWVGIFAALLVGLAAGYINGLIITKLRMNSFVVTLATSFVFTGLAYGITAGSPYSKIPNGILFVMQQKVGIVSYAFIIMIILALILLYVFGYLLIGRRLLATGGNAEAARLSGINTRRMIIYANIASGFFAAFAGLMTISRIGAASPQIGGDWLIYSFAVPVLGGVALSGGVITPIGLVASSILLAMMKNGLIMLKVNVYWEQTFLGLIILLAIFIDALRMRLSNTRFQR
jgi:ribose transport system permease protein